MALGFPVALQILEKGIKHPSTLINSFEPLLHYIRSAYTTLLEINIEINLSKFSCQLLNLSLKKKKNLHFITSLCQFVLLTFDVRSSTLTAWQQH